MKTVKNTLLLCTVALLAACGSAPRDSGTPTAAVTGGKTRPYPLKTCLVTDSDLHSMGGPVRKVYNAQEVKFCCRPCVRTFEEDSSKYLSKLQS